MPKDYLAKELANRAVYGYAPVTVTEVNKQLNVLGYELDRSRDCPGLTRHMTGPNAGESYLALTTGVREIDTKLSFAHSEARRDDNFRALQLIRYNQSLFSVVRGRILDI